MLYQVILSSAAIRDIENTLAWYDQNNILQAKQDWHNMLLERLISLESEPERWPLAAEAQEMGIEIRELLIGRRGNIHRILYIVWENQVQVLRVRHSSMDSLKPGDV